MRKHRIGFGLFARAVYILWAAFCIFLGWLWLEGREIQHNFTVDDWPQSEEDARELYAAWHKRQPPPCADLEAEHNRVLRWYGYGDKQNAALEAWDACVHKNLKPNKNTVYEPQEGVEIDAAKSAPTLKHGICVNANGLRTICPQIYLDGLFSGAWQDLREDKKAIKQNVFFLFALGLILFYPFMWVVSAVLESDVYEKLVKHGTGGSARWGGVLAFRKYAWKRCVKAPIYLGWTMHK